MGEGITDCLPLALRSVGDAIKLDSDNRIKVWVLTKLAKEIQNHLPGSKHFWIAPSLEYWDAG